MAPQPTHPAEKNCISRTSLKRVALVLMSPQKLKGCGKGPCSHLKGVREAVLGPLDMLSAFSGVRPVSVTTLRSHSSEGAHGIKGSHGFIGGGGQKAGSAVETLPVGQESPTM